MALAIGNPYCISSCFPETTLSQHLHQMLSFLRDIEHMYHQAAGVMECSLLEQFIIRLLQEKQEHR